MKILIAFSIAVVLYKLIWKNGFKNGVKEALELIMISAYDTLDEDEYNRFRESMRKVLGIEEL